MRACAAADFSQMRHQMPVPSGRGPSGLSGRLFQKLAHPAELGVTGLEKLLGPTGRELADCLEQINLEPRGHLEMITVSAAQRLLDHVVDDSQAEQIPRR